jgi:hypothetical protein
MSLERRVSLAAAFVIALTLIAGGYILFSDGRDNLAASEKTQIDTTSLVFLTALSQAESLTVSHAELLARDAGLLRLMQAADRAGLQVSMKPVYDLLKVEAGVDVLHFQTADMKSFLRVWKPDDYGQDLSRIRPMVLSANKGRQSQKGLEIGLAGLSLRAVSPMIVNGSVAGTVEVGVSLMSLMELAKSATGSDFAIFLDPQFIPDGKGGYGTKGASLKLDVSTDNRLFSAAQARGLVAMTREPTSNMTDYEDRNLGLLVRPVLDYSGKSIGVLVVAKDFSANESAFRGSWITVAVVAICGFLVAYALIMIALRSFVFRPLEQLAIDATGSEPPAATSGLVSYLGLRDGVIAEMRMARGERNAEAE